MILRSRLKLGFQTEGIISVGVRCSIVYQIEKQSQEYAALRNLLAAARTNTLPKSGLELQRKDFSNWF